MQFNGAFYFEHLLTPSREAERERGVRRKGICRPGGGVPLWCLLLVAACCYFASLWMMHGDLMHDVS